MPFGKTVEVRYCGGCNPEINRAELVKDIRFRLQGRVILERSPLPDLLLLVNGCPHACLDEEMGQASSLPVVSIQGCRLDTRIMVETELAEAVAEKILARLGADEDL